MPPSALILHAQLQEINPPIWRRLAISNQASFSDLHSALVLAFRWMDYHLHEFETPAGRLGIPDEEDGFDDPDLADDTKVKLSKHLKKRGNAVTYTYHLGDDWRVAIKVEDILVGDAVPAKLPALLDGARAAPPEDCGGVWGYERLLNVLADPNHEEHEQLKEWAEGQVDRLFDPEHFDVAEFDQWARRLEELAELEA